MRKTPTMRTTLRGLTVAPAVLISILIGSNAYAGAHSECQAEASEAAQDAPSLDALVKQLETAHDRAKSLRILLSFRSRIPDPKGSKPLEMKALLRLEALEEDGVDGKRRWSRLDVDLVTPQGVLRTEKVRTPDGIRIHQASELTGEKWYSIDRATMLRLDKASRVLGNSGALPIQGATSPSSVVGADLVRGLSRSYDLKVERDVEIDGEACYAIGGKLRGSVEDPDLELPRERPDSVQLFFSKKTKLLKRMMQFQQGRELYSIQVRDVDFGVTLAKSRFALAPPKGTRFVDVFDDELGSLRIRMDLKRLEDWEAAQKKKAKEASTTDDKKKRD